jgi:hypothetical protein
MSYIELSEMATILELLIKAGADTQCPVEWTTEEWNRGPWRYEIRKHSRMAHEQIYTTFIAQETDLFNPSLMQRINPGRDVTLTDEESATIKQRGEQLLLLLDDGKSFRVRFLRQVRRGQTYIRKKTQARYPTSQI